MNISMKRLVDDHINLRYTLVVLSRYIKQCQTTDDMVRSSDFIRVALDYLCDYPQLFHHPVEERLIQFLLSRDTSILSIGDDVVREHRQLEMNTCALRQQFSHELHITNDEHFKLLKEQLLDIIEQHHNHLEHEEKYFMPLLERVMNREDWAEFGLKMIRNTHTQLTMKKEANLPAHFFILLNVKKELSHQRSSHSLTILG
jgi:hypothetical protein